MDEWCENKFASSIAHKSALQSRYQSTEEPIGVDTQQNTSELASSTSVFNRIIGDVNKCLRVVVRSLLLAGTCDAMSSISIQTHSMSPPPKNVQHFYRYRRPPRSLEEDEPRRPNISLDLEYLDYDNGNEVLTNQKEPYTHQPVVLEQEDPHFAEPIPSVTVAAGKTAELKCIIENLGNYTVAWLNVDKQTLLAVHTHVISNQDRVRVSHSGHREFSLLIEDVRPEDSGYYMCQVNTRPMKNQVGFLNVVVAPYFLESVGSNITVRENDNAVLRCHAGGNPQPKVTWRREDSQVFNLERRLKATTYQGSELHLRGVGRKDMGVYICLASNGVPSSISRRIHLEVIFPPLIRVPHQLVQASLGDNVILECHVEASPLAEPVWLHRSQRLGSDHKYHTSNSQEDLRTTMRLRVKITHRSDFGMYRCTAQNKIGHTEAKITLLERRPTSMPTTTTVRPTKAPRKPSKRPSQSLSPPTTPLMYWITTKAPVFVSIFDINKGNMSTLWHRNRARESSSMASEAVCGCTSTMHLLLTGLVLVRIVFMPRNL
ncbi:lachesin [Galendromus occidentalis]|uniref:Lachesin n=1 Tax=Galendromus occidentalis TaxID=34638 RepID=A0AAJ7SI83_9ACAR|nr:lachesin [Galendromus occidentalis]